MEDGNAYYKIFDMKREYYIGADKCYILDKEVKEIALYYYAMHEEFLSKKFHIKINEKLENVLISEKNEADSFNHYNLEQD